MGDDQHKKEKNNKKKKKGSGKDRQNGGDHDFHYETSRSKGGESRSDKFKRGV